MPGTGGVRTTNRDGHHDNRKTIMYLQNDGWGSKIQHQRMSEDSFTTRCGIQNVGTISFIEVSEAPYLCVNCRQAAEDDAPRKAPIHREPKPAKHPAVKKRPANEQIQFSMF
jgi:hypothetical protein